MVINLNLWTWMYIHIHIAKILEVAGDFKTPDIFSKEKTSWQKLWTSCMMGTSLMVATGLQSTAGLRTGHLEAPNHPSTGKGTFRTETFKGF